MPKTVRKKKIIRGIRHGKGSIPVQSYPYLMLYEHQILDSEDNQCQIANAETGDPVSHAKGRGIERA